LTVEAGVDIAAARQDQSVESLGERSRVGREGQVHRQATGGRDLAGVVGEVQLDLELAVGRELGRGHRAHGSGPARHTDQGRRAVRAHAVPTPAVALRAAREVTASM
jgi:hypothetical protein